MLALPQVSSAGKWCSIVNHMMESSPKILNFLRELAERHSSESKEELFDALTRRPGTSRRENTRVVSAVFNTIDKLVNLCLHAGSEHASVGIDLRLLTEAGKECTEILMQDMLRYSGGLV